MRGEGPISMDAPSLTEARSVMAFETLSLRCISQLLPSNNPPQNVNACYSKTLLNFRILKVGSLDLRSATRLADLKGL